jgi:hypothetical protein
MPRLETTIDNLEWKSNKIISTSTTAPDDWTDAQYPSALTLLNTAHPVGSILTTATKTDPANTVGGTWKLVDKTFGYRYITLDSTFWTGTNASIYPTSTAASVILSDHMFSLKMTVQVNIPINDDNSVPLGTLALRSCGIEKLPQHIMYAPAVSDEGNCTIAYYVGTDGKIEIYEALNLDGTHSMASGSVFYVYLTQPIYYENMLDEFCDKFYWERTA